MAITAIAARGVGASGSNSSTLAIALTGTVAIDRYLFVVIAGDNKSTTDGDNNEVQSVVVAGPGGQVFTKQGEYSNGSPGVDLGSLASVWAAKMTSELDIGVSPEITVTFTASRVDKCGALYEFSVGAGSTLTQSAAPIGNEVTGANDFGSVAFSGLSNVEHLWFRGLGKEANTTTALTPTATFTNIPGTRSRNNAAAQIVRGEFLISTATGVTSNPTLAVIGDTAGIFLAFEEVVSVSTYLLVAN